MQDAMLLGEAIFWISLVLGGGAMVLRSVTATRRPDPWR